MFLTSFVHPVHCLWKPRDIVGWWHWRLELWTQLRGRHSTSSMFSHTPENNMQKKTGWWFFGMSTLTSTCFRISQARIHPSIYLSIDLCIYLTNQPTNRPSTSKPLYILWLVESMQPPSNISYCQTTNQDNDWLYPTVLEVFKPHLKYCSATKCGNGHIPELSGGSYLGKSSNEMVNFPASNVWLPKDINKCGKPNHEPSI